MVGEHTTDRRAALPLGPGNQAPCSGSCAERASLWPSACGKESVSLMGCASSLTAFQTILAPGNSGTANSPRPTSKAWASSPSPSSTVAQGAAVCEAGWSVDGAWSGCPFLIRGKGKGAGCCRVRRAWHGPALSIFSLLPGLTNSRSSIGTQSPSPLTLLKPVKADAHLWPILCKNTDKLICTCFAVVLEKSRP